MKTLHAFLHPRRTAREYTALRTEAAELKETVETLRAEVVAARADASEARTDCARYEATVASLLDQLAAARSDLDAERAFTADVAELNRRCSEMQTVYERYEARIARLKEALAEARASARRPAIRLDTPPEAPDSDSTEEPEDWFMPPK